MAITVTTAPADYALAKTEVLVKLTTDNLFSDAGSKAVFEILCDSYSTGNFPIENETFTIAFGDTSLVFVFKDAPDDSGLQLTSGVGAGPDYAFTLFRDLKRNLTLLEEFDFTYEYDPSDNLVTVLTAKTEKEYTTFDLSGTVTSLTWLTETDGTDPVRRPNFEILLDVFSEPTLHGTVYTYPMDLLAQLAAKPSDDGVVTFDIAEILKTVLNTQQPNFSVAVTTGNYIAVVDGAMRRYHLRYAERYGTTPTERIFLGWPADDEADLSNYWAWVLNAGANNVDRPTFNTNFSTNYRAGSQRKFLTHHGTTYNLPTNAPLIVDGLSTSDTTFKAVVVMYYTDGTNSTSTIATISKDSNQRVLRFRLGYTELGLDALKTVGKTVQYYTVAIKDSGGSTQLFNTLTVNVTPSKKFERFFLFENSLGGVDVLYTSGNFDTGIEFKNQITQHYSTDATGGVYNGEFAEANNRTQETMELHSGYVTKDEVNYLKDFLYTGNRYLLVGTTLVRINVPAQNITLYTDRSQLYALKLKIEKAFVEKAL